MAERRFNTFISEKSHCDEIIPYPVTILTRFCCLLCVIKNDSETLYKFIYIKETVAKFTKVELDEKNVNNYTVLNAGVSKP